MTQCEFIGNCTSKSLAKEFNAKFAEKDIQLKLAEDEEDDEEDEEDEESDPEEEDDVDKERIEELMAKLEQLEL